MKHPVDDLMAEHRVIESVLDAIECELSSGDSSAFRADFWQQVAEFAANYADRRHHGKEEEVLFPMLREAGLPEGEGPVACMLHEHVQGRELVGQLRQAAQDGRAEPTYAAARGYVHLLRDHIAKEDQVLFEMARQMLSAEQVERLREGFDTVNAECSGVDAAEYMAVARG